MLSRFPVYCDKRQAFRSFRWDSNRRGFNAVTNYTASQMSAWGVTLVRARPSISWPGTGRIRTPVIDWTAFDNLVATCDPLDIRIVIDPHSSFAFANGGTTHANDMHWFQLECQASFATLWTMIATHCVGLGAVIAGYDILNEPQTPRNGSSLTPFPAVLTSGTLPTLAQQQAFPGYQAGDPAWQVGGQDPRSYAGFIDRMVTAIRSVDTAHTIMSAQCGLGGDGYGGYIDRWSCPTNWYVPDDPLGHQNKVFTAHNYSSQTFQTQDGTTFVWEVDTVPGWGLLNRASIAADLQDLQDFVNAEGVPCYIGECGPFPLNQGVTPSVARVSAVEFFLNEVAEYDARGWATTIHTISGGLYGWQQNPALFKAWQDWLLSRRQKSKIIWDDTRRGPNLTNSDYTGWEFWKMNATLVRREPFVTWTWAGDGTTTLSSEGTAGTPGGRPLNWTPPNGDSRIWTPSFDWASWDAMLDDFAVWNVRLIADPHWFPGWCDYSTMKAWYWAAHNIQYWDNAAVYWGAMAQHNAGRGPEFAAYALVNEPQFPNFGTSGSPASFPPIITNASLPTLSQQQAFPGWRAGDPVWQVGDRDPRSYRQFIDTCVAAIRQYDTRRPIIVPVVGVGGGTSAGDPISYSAGGFADRNTTSAVWYVPADALGNKNIVMDLHWYEPGAWQTQDQVNYGYPASGVPGVSGTLNITWMRNWIAPYVSYAASAGVQKAITEHGPYSMVDLASGRIEKTGCVAFLNDLYTVIRENGMADCLHTVNEFVGTTVTAKTYPDFWSGVQAQWLLR